MDAVYQFWIEGYTEELAAMNRGKVGRPYEYTNSFVMWAPLIMGLGNLDWRGLCGEISAIVDWAAEVYRTRLPEGFHGPDYTTLFRRFDFEVQRLVSGDDMGDDRVLTAFANRKTTSRVRECAVESTALNLSNTNLWRKTKWGVGPKYRGWIKVHALVDVDTNEIVAAVVTTDKMGDNTAFTMLSGMACKAGHKIGDICGLVVRVQAELEGLRGEEIHPRRQIQEELHREEQRLHDQRSRGQRIPQHELRQMAREDEIRAQMEIRSHVLGLQGPDIRADSGGD
jgi:hypothetical protein